MLYVKIFASYMKQLSVQGQVLQPEASQGR
jgi:hypothetical protein